MMVTTTTFAALLLQLLTVHASLDLYKPGDVIIGQLLPVSQSSGNLQCAAPDLASVIKVEALLYAVNRLSKEGLRIGYDIIDTCSNSTPRTRLNFATKKWFEDEKNMSRIPTAIITDLSSVNEFNSVASERESNGKDMPVVSLQYRKKLWGNTYSMSPDEKRPLQAILGLVRHLQWNILDIVQYDGDNGFESFKEISKDNGNVCLLNELSFIAGELKWKKRGKRVAPVAVLFSKDDKISEFIDELPPYNLSNWDIILGHQVPEGKHRWASNMAGVIGIRRNRGNLKGFEDYLKTSKLFENEAAKALCSNGTAGKCADHKEKFINQNIHLGASVIDAVYAVIKSRQTGSNQSPKTGLTGIQVTSATGRVVSFDPDDFAINEILYDVLNFRAKKVVKVGGVEFGPSLKVSINKEIVWKNESPQARCSADCKPSTWRKYWDGFTKCCWDCVACDIGTVSSYANSSRCVKCPVGTKPTADQTKCKPPYIDYLKWYDPFSLVMIFLLTFTICFLIYAVNIFVKKANTPVFQRSKTATLPLLLSLFVTFVLPVLLLMKPTQSSCGAYNAIFMFSLGIPLTFLIARSHMVYNYCYGDDGEQKRKWFRCSPQTVISLVLIILQLIIVVIVLALAPAKVLILDTPEPDVEYIECASHSRPAFLPLVFFILVLIMAFNILHMSEVSSPLNQNEVKFVSLGIYLMYTIIFVYFVAVFGMNGKKKIRVLCGMAYLCGLNFFATIFLPKIYVILFRPEENLPEVSRLLQDENGNQDAARLSKRECVESPLLGLHAGPYDRTEV